MSRISYFQRFSQRENHATNNTILALRRFYETSPDRLQSILASLTGADLAVGFSFQQQVHREFSVPDALITQQALHVYFETKRGGAVDLEQLRRHVESVAKERQNGPGTWILLCLTKESVPKLDSREIASFSRERGVVFSAVTFSQVLQALTRECAEFERDLLLMIDDFRAYLGEERLLEEGQRVMPVFACGTSLNENVRFGVYYEPISRPSKANYRFIGVYADKAVRYLGRIVSVSNATFDGDDLIVENEIGDDTPSLRSWILSVVEHTPYYDLRAEPNRYYRVGEFYPTNLRKREGVIRAVQYVDLSYLIPGYEDSKEYSAEQIAELIKGQQFE